MSNGLMVAGTSSGCGKTTLTLALLAALAARGDRLAPFKVGPDFIDPGHHARVTGVASRNLDGWMLSPETNRAIFARGSRKADWAIVEGVMGLFDGYDGRSEAGSTAQLAKWLDLPVLLIVDARSMARSAAALVQGFERFDPGLRFAGVVFNRIGSPRHLTYLREALQGQVAMPCLGGIPREATIAIPERHLGLHTAEDHPLDEAATAGLAALVEEHLDLERLLARMAAGTITRRRAAKNPSKSASDVRIGVARDRAFCFYYPDNLELLANQGAEMVFFSPLTDDRLPQALDGLYFGGGYPELQAERLSANQGLLAAVRNCCHRGMPIYAECGGFMYLCERLTDIHGQAHSMAGCFPFGTRMLPRRKALGYREIETVAASPLGPAGLVGRGHEFHYSELDATNDACTMVYAAAPRSDSAPISEGYRVHNTLGSYIHLHFGSNPAMAKHFVDNCRRFRQKGRATNETG
jgi:cobyrinic acid a,c-diamide synthase